MAPIAGVHLNGVGIGRPELFMTFPSQLTPHHSERRRERDKYATKCYRAARVGLPRRRLLVNSDDSYSRHGTVSSRGWNPRRLRAGDNSLAEAECLRA